MFQLSIQPEKDPAWHLAVGHALADLKRNGVLVIGSGSATHNLRELRRGQNDTIDGWAAAFDDWLAARIEAGDEAALVDYRRAAPNAVRALRSWARAIASSASRLLPMPACAST